MHLTFTTSFGGLLTPPNALSMDYSWIIHACGNLGAVSYGCNCLQHHPRPTGGGEAYTGQVWESSSHTQPVILQPSTVYGMACNPNLIHSHILYIHKSVLVGIYIVLFIHISPCVSAVWSPVCLLQFVMARTSVWRLEVPPILSHLCGPTIGNVIIQY